MHVDGRGICTVYLTAVVVACASSDVMVLTRQRALEWMLIHIQKRETIQKQQTSMTVQVTPVSDGTRRFSSEMAFVAEGLGTSNVHTKKKFDNILALTGPAELNDDYVNVYSTCALVGALVMSFLAPAASARPSVDSHSNIWGPVWTPWVIEANQVLVVVAFFISFLMVFLACVMLTQLAHIPKNETRLLFERMGDAKVHAPLAHMQKLLALYAVHFLLSTSLTYHTYTSLVSLGVTVISISWAVCTALSMVTIKNKTLELIRERAS